MNKENFNTLKEIQVLKKELFTKEKSVVSQKKRIQDLESQKIDREAKLKQDGEILKTVSSDLTKKEEELFKVETRTTSALKNQTAITNQTQLLANQKELDELKSIQSHLEEEVLLLLEKKENLTNEIETHNNFLKGLEKTFKEITSEVNTIIQSEDKEIISLKERITNLLSTSKELTDLYKMLENKFSDSVFLSFPNEGKCSSCRFLIEKSILSLIEKGSGIEYCPSCRRLLCP